MQNQVVFEARPLSATSGFIAVSTAANLSVIGYKRDGAQLQIINGETGAMILILSGSDADAAIATINSWRV